MVEPRSLRCAIYTRTSSDEGLLQDYNSLAAQRDACAAYILSQKHEGWVRTRRLYEDGGFSGGNLERPGLQDLLLDLAAGQIDVVVIYKIDRLTRSLRDFARLSEIFHRSNASFVAVTQQFNTASSMGRLTLNILLTFAQFEREVAGDRIRDKRASSTRLGIWMGGNPALGYDAPAKKLVVNAEEAETVRHIYRRFLELQCMTKLRHELTQAGIVSKRRTLKGGLEYGGVNFTWYPLHKILTNPIYKGMIRHRDQVYRGRHEPIIDEALFDRVQVLVKRVAAREKERRSRAYPSLLRGILFDMAGDPLYPRHTLKHPAPGRSIKYNYYISESLAVPKHLCSPRTPLRISAPLIERYIVDLLCARLRDRRWIEENVPTIRRLQATFKNAELLAAEIEGQLARNTGVVPQLVSRIELDRITLRLLLERRWLLDRLGIVPVKGAPQFAGGPIEVAVNGHEIRCGHDMKVVLESPRSPPQPDHRMVREVLRAVRWFEAFSSGQYATVEDLAKSEGCSPGLISDRMRLAFLAPDIVEAILEGRQPASMTVALLLRSCPLPMSWQEQRILLLANVLERI